jgi:hypothetical protein
MHMIKKDLYAFLYLKRNVLRSDIFLRIFI